MGIEGGCGFEKGRGGFRKRFSESLSVREREISGDSASIRERSEISIRDPRSKLPTAPLPDYEKRS